MKRGERGREATVMTPEKRPRRRSRAAAKQAGAQFEIRQAEYLSEQLENPYISRQDKGGSADLGDIAYIGHQLAGVGPSRRPIVAEAKNRSQLNLTGAMREARAEAENYRAKKGGPLPLPIVLHKRHGVAAHGQQWATMEVDTLIEILKLANP